MGSFTFAIAAAAAAASATADPFVAAIGSNGGTMCFTRSYDAAWLKGHKGQTVREARLLITTSKSGRPMMRLKIAGSGKPIYSYGECRWYAGDLNRGVQNNVLDESFKPTTGVGCHLYTDIDGSSAEEGGDFPAEWGADGKTLQVHLPEHLAGWRSPVVSRNADFHPLRAADRIIRLNHAAQQDCDELRRFAPTVGMDDL